MSSSVFSYVLALILLITAQVLVLNNIQVSGLLNPYIYVYFIIILPVDFSRLGTLFLGFGLGIVLDLFHQTLGLHTVATVFLAYCRPFVLEYMAPRDGYDFTRSPSIREMGYLWFMAYSGILVFLHHFMLFFIEMFRLSGFWYTIGKVAGSTFLTLLLVLLLQMLFTRSSINRSAL